MQKKKNYLKTLLLVVKNKFMSDETKYEVVDEITNEVEPVASLEFGEEEVTATLEDGEKVVFENKDKEGQLENDTHVIQDGKDIVQLNALVVNVSDSIKEITDTASAAKNDAAATRAYTEWIVARFGQNPDMLWQDKGTSSTSISNSNL